MAVSSINPNRFANGWAKDNSLPSVGDSVVCVFMGSGVGSGYCLGSFTAVVIVYRGIAISSGSILMMAVVSSLDRSKKSFVIVGDLEFPVKSSKGDSS
ncbi:hypothetical protein P7H22_26665 [Paenibacillus larvae]|nr:hypothetical protein [Paenibacillus larvae]MDT2243188.1 hypothetical protein [Paenibacillus larvae]